MNNILIIIGILLIIKIIIGLALWQWIAAFGILIKEIYE